MLPNPENTDLRSLVAHDFRIQTDDTVATAYDLYARNEHKFAAVLDGDKISGMCSREKLGLLLSQQFGRSLYSRKTVGELLVLPVTIVNTSDPITQILEKVFTRPADHFFDDVLLADEAGRYIGMIPMRRLVRLQHGYFVDQIRLLNQQQRELNERNSEMQQELNMAGQLQASLLPPPKSLPAARPSLAYAYRIAPLGTVSGDSIFVLDSHPRKLGILLCDVMGHGVRAALISVMIRALIQRDARKDILPGEILTRLNRDLAGHLRQNDATIFITACCIIVDEETREIHCARAGHHVPFHVRANSTAMGLPQGGEVPQPAIGLLENTTYKTWSFPLTVGDRFLIFTDGLFEVTNSDGEEFGQQRLLEQIENLKNSSVDEMLDQILVASQKFAAPRPLGDDACVAALTYE